LAAPRTIDYTMLSRSLDELAEHAAERARQHLVVDGAWRGEADRGGLGRQQRLVGVEQFLLQLLARPEADERDLDVLARLPPGEADHLAGEVDDLHRVAHIEHEELAALLPTLDRQH